LFVFIIGGQAFPLEIFPGYQVSSSFGDGAVMRYVPSLPELLLGIGGLGAAFLLTLVGVRVLDFLPSDDAASTKA
jgi:molybdopterin-containing oxidoreductase family membrane subunit